MNVQLVNIQCSLFEWGNNGRVGLLLPSVIDLIANKFDWQWCDMKCPVEWLIRFMPGNGGDNIVAASSYAGAGGLVK